ncbi:ABC transporter permease [bacterium]|nr:ABC transporter permease [bacterium]
MRSKRRTGFISLITYLSVGGVALGAAALVIVLSIMNGFEEEVRSRIIGADAHLQVSTFHDQGAGNWQTVVDSIKNMKYVEAVTPYVMNKGMLRHKQRSEGCVIRGIDPLTAGSVTDLPNMIVSGDLDSLNTSDDSLPGLVLGIYMADLLYTGVGDTVFLFSPSGTSMFAQPRVGKYKVVGVFESGLAEFDQVFVYISLHEAQKLFAMDDKVSGVEVRTTTLKEAANVKAEINDKIGYPWYPRTWFEMRKTLFSWMQLEKWAMFTILSLIILVAAFNIISTLVMVTMEKRKEIGILVAMGASRTDVARIFVFQGLVVGLLGTIFGLSLGFVILWAQQTYGFISLPSDIYLLSKLPVLMQFWDFLAVGVIGVILCLLAAVYPARSAAALDPVEAIRYE